MAEPFELQVQRWRDNELKLILLQREARQQLVRAIYRETVRRF